MNRNNDIRQELIDLNSPLAETPVAIPYTIDAEYFNAFGALLQKRLDVEHSDETIIIGKMDMPFTVPVAYFENFGDEMLGVVKMVDFEAKPKMELPYRVPTAYFDVLGADMLGAAKIADFETSLPKSLPYELPLGYFNQLPEKILSGAKNSEVAKTEPKIIRLRPTHQLRYIKWAVAAMLVLSVGLGSYKYFFMTPNTEQGRVEAMLSNVSKNDINEYVDIHGEEFGMNSENSKCLDNLNSQLNQFDKDDITNYLNETGGEFME